MPNFIKISFLKLIITIVVFAILYIILSSLFPCNNIAIVIFLFISLGIVIAVFYNFSVFKIEYIGYLNKIWAHQVNTLEKLNLAQSNYTGIELDIVFDSTTNTFDVHHPPDLSIGLTLETYLSHLKSPKNIRIWLDLKNLTMENKEKALRRLLFLVEKYSLQKERIIVESQQPEFLIDFKKFGFLTSYYLPATLHTLTPETLADIIEEINTKINLYPTTAISSNLVDYPLIAKQFPKQKKYLWALHKTYSASIFTNFKRTRIALKDSKVQVLLVHVNTLNAIR